MSDSSDASRRSSVLRWAIPIALLGCVAIGVTTVSGLATKMDNASQALTHTVDRGDVIVTVTEQGTVESSENTEIKCKVRGQNTVIYVVDSGTYVEPGDVLVRLDTLFIEEQIAERTKYALWSRSGAEHSEANVKRSRLAVEEYVPADPNAKGRFAAELMSLEKDLAIAEASLLNAQNRQSHAELMAKSGYLSAREKEERLFAVERSKLNVEQTRTQIDVLKKFTRAETLETLRGNLAAAVATHKANAERALADASRRDRALEELKHCVVKADRAGMVIHPSAARWKNAPEIEEGATVHRDQVLLLMPNLAQMQVTIGVHESIVDRVTEGLPAKIMLPDRELPGEVTSVASVTSPAGWWTGNVVKYETVVQLPANEPDLRPGMSAEVDIIIAHYDNVVRIPVAAVLETESAHYAWTIDQRGQTNRHELVLGDNNEVFIVVKEGLNVGDEVILNPLAHVEEAQQLGLKATTEPNPQEETDSDAVETNS